MIDWKLKIQNVERLLETEKARIIDGDYPFLYLNKKGIIVAFDNGQKVNFQKYRDGLKSGEFYFEYKNNF